MNALVPIQTSNAEVYRASTDAAGLCREIVMKTAMTIQDRKYVKVEDTVKSFKAILEGKYDNVPEQAFYMKGSIDEVK